MTIITLLNVKNVVIKIVFQGQIFMNLKKILETIINKKRWQYG